MSSINPRPEHGDESIDARQAFRDAMARVAFSVSVVTTDGVAGRAGMTATALSSVSINGPQPVLLVSLSAAARTTKAILENGVFCVNVLSEHSSALADSFAGRAGADGHHRFDGAEWTALETGSPALVGAVAQFDCRVESVTLVDDHSIVFGRVVASAIPEDVRPLVHWHRSYGRLGD